MLDVLIVGGGIAGLWLLDDLRHAGYDALLIEKKALGSGQTIASQGILHSGFKHAIAGRLGTYTDALRDMPTLWRDCLADRREPLLGRIRLRASSCLCWRTGGLGSAISQIGARVGLRTNVTAIRDDERPSPLLRCPGDVLRLDEQVIDPSSLIETLATRNASSTLLGQVERFALDAPGMIREALIVEGRRIVTLKAMNFVFTAGTGNEELRRACGLADGSMRRLPLPILTVEGNLPDLNGFCMDGGKAKAVITTQRINEMRAVWQVASERAGSDTRDAFELTALRELQESLPGFRWPTVSVKTYVTDRAEAAEDNGRANDVYASRSGNVITAWPTKLVLAPRLADKICTLLPPPELRSTMRHAPEGWHRPPVAPFPWL